MIKIVVLYIQPYIIYIEILGLNKVITCCKFFCQFLLSLTNNSKANLLTLCKFISIYIFDESEKEAEVKIQEIATIEE